VAVRHMVRGRVVAHVPCGECRKSMVTGGTTADFHYPMMQIIIGPIAMGKK